MTYYKCLDADGKSCHGGKKIAWPMPSHGRPGKWLPALNGKPALCDHGYHFCRDEQVLSWLSPMLCEVEVERETEIIVGDDKCVTVGHMRIVRVFRRWDERTARLFACNCAERALKQERKAGRELDARSWEAIRVSRRFASGKATAEELAAARYAARYAAWAAARDAACNAERRWQYKRLLKYLNGEAKP